MKIIPCALASNIAPNIDNGQSEATAAVSHPDNGAKAPLFVEAQGQYAHGLHPKLIPAQFLGTSIVIGNFDGLHHGHRRVLARARTARSAARVAMLTFEPHPRTLFRPDDPPFRLTPWPIKARWLGAAGVDVTFAMNFDRLLSQMTAEAFVADVLVAGFHPAHVTVGYDFSFGHGRRGNPAILEAILARYGIGLTVATPEVSADGEVYSSSRVRSLLRTGHPGLAAEVLGAPWEIEGRVTHGDARGRTLGFPTANVPLGDYLRPLSGVYAVRVGVPKDGQATAPPAHDPALWDWLDGVANIGHRPTVGGTEARVEAHLFNTNRDLYGQSVRIQLHEFIRAEEKFAGLDALKAQIQRDCTAARAALTTAE